MAMPEEMNCPEGNLWNDNTKQCDWPRNVECNEGNSLNSGSGENSGSGGNSGSGRNSGESGMVGTVGMAELLGILGIMGTKVVQNVVRKRRYGVVQIDTWMVNICL